MYTRSMQNTGRLQKRHLSGKQSGVCREHHSEIHACPLRDTGPGGARLSLRPMLLFPIEIWERCAIGFGMCLGNDKTTIVTDVDL